MRHFGDHMAHPHSNMGGGWYVTHFTVEYPKCSASAKEYHHDFHDIFHNFSPRNFYIFHVKISPLDIFYLSHHCEGEGNRRRRKNICISLSSSCFQYTHLLFYIVVNAPLSFGIPPAPLETHSLLWAKCPLQSHALKCLLNLGFSKVGFSSVWKSQEVNVVRDYHAPPLLVVPPFWPEKKRWEVQQGGPKNSFGKQAICVNHPLCIHRQHFSWFPA